MAIKQKNQLRDYDYETGLAPVAKPTGNTSMSVAGYNKQYSIGSTGTDVKALQNKLIESGYGKYLGASQADGVYGKNTAEAVKRYQEDNGIDVDGIAGKNTLGKLYGSSIPTTPTPKPTEPVPTTKPTEPAPTTKPTEPVPTPTPTEPTPTPTPKPTDTNPTPKPSTQTENDVPNVSNPSAPPPATNTTTNGYTYEAFAPSDETIAAGKKKDEIYAQKPGEFTYDPYAKSDIVLQADALLQQWVNGKPGDYKPVWQDEADAYLSQYQNRDPFSYDFNADALYNQYKDQYIQQGQMAMMDTMGQAAALTGGYGNSYAQTVGQQAYNQQLNQLNEIMPELYAMAYDRYNQEGQDLLNMYGIYMDREAQEYGKHQDNLNNWYTHLDYLQKDAQYKSEDDYSKWLDQTNMDYKQWQDGYNSWLDYYNQADENYWNLYGRDYTAWSDDTRMGFDNYWKNTEMDYQKDRDKIDDSQWQASFGADESWRQKEFDYGVERDNYNKLADLITAAGYEPSASELAAAGMTKEEAKALKDARDASVSNPGGNGTGDSGIKLENVASMSSYELVGYLQSYQKKGDNTGLEAFLDDCVSTGRLAQGQADEYYAQYRTEESGGGAVDTTVDPFEEEKKKRQHGGSSGVLGTKK